MATAATPIVIDHAFLAKIGALYEPEEFEARLDRELAAKLARANPELYGLEAGDAPAAETTERRAFMSPASSTASDLQFDLELEDVLEMLATLSVS